VKSPLALFSRMLPYVLISFTSMYFVLGLLKQFGGLRFGGSIFVLAVPLFLYLLATGLLAMLLSFNISDPKKATPRLAAIVAPSFFLSNLMMPTLIMPKLIQWIAVAFPLNWYGRCWQAIALRGAPLDVLRQELGALLILTGVFALLLMIRIKKSDSHKEAASNENILQEGTL
jgi:ABC-2 type transport system permease protein